MIDNDDTTEPGKKSGRSGRVLRFLAYWGAVAGIWLTVGLIGLVAWYAYELPSVDAPGRALPTRGPTVKLLYADGRELTSVGGAWGEEVAFDGLPKSLVDAVVATEDRRFFDHVGMDVIGLVRAAVANLMAGRVVQGGSTITQQLAKNVFLTPERTLRRKLLEAMMAFWLEAKYSKPEIFALYINRVYLGSGAYGVDAAARRYFGVPVSQLSLTQSAILAGLLKAPSRYAPDRNARAAEKRTRVVIANMLAAGHLDAEGAAKAGRELNRTLSRVKAAKRRRSAGGARYFADWVHEQLADYVSQSGREVVVRTTLDSRLQQAAEAAVANGLDGEGKKRGAGQAALVAMTAGGAVKAMVGGRSYAGSQFNRAVAAQRQPGSTFKLFVYLAALENGYKPDSRVVDGPVTVEGWSPRNFADYRGKVSLTEALAYSLNSVPVKLSEKIGRNKVVEAARRLGLTGKLEPHPSLALGVAEVTPLEMTAAYAAVAGGGRGVWPYAITEISDSAGEVLYRRSGSGPGQVAEVAPVRALTGMLREAVSGGTGRAARLKRPAAGKTGTSQDHRDAWFVGFTADLVAGVWVGNDNAAPMKNVTGGGLPARIWASFMRDAHRGQPARPLTAGLVVKEEPRSWLEKIIGGGSSPESSSSTTRPDR